MHKKFHSLKSSVGTHKGCITGIEEISNKALFLSRLAVSPFLTDLLPLQMVHRPVGMNKECERKVLQPVEGPYRCSIRPIDPHSDVWVVLRSTGMVVVTAGSQVRTIR